MTIPQLLKNAALSVAVVAALPSVALAQPVKQAKTPCFLSPDVEGFSAPNDHTVYLRVGVKDIYRLDLTDDCLNLSFRESLGLESTPGSPWVCSPLDATIVYRDTGIMERCPVESIHKLTPADLTTLPKRERP